VNERDTATGVEATAARGPSSGQLIYAANGRLSVQIMTLDRGSIPTGSAEGFSSYFGRWEIATGEGCVIHHFDGHLNAEQAGGAAKRFYAFAAGRLSLATPPTRRDDGRTTSIVFVWERLG